jgi:hypothetical protein
VSAVSLNRVPQFGQRIAYLKLELPRPLHPQPWEQNPHRLGLTAPQGMQRRELRHAGHPSLALLGRTTEDEGVESFGCDRKRR